MDLTPSFQTEGTYSPDNLKAGDFPMVTDTVTVAQAAGAQPRGAVLGRITADGKYVLSAAAANDGSETPDVILLQAVDATAGDVLAPVALSGEFTARALTFGAGHTAASTKAGLRAKSIYLCGSVA